MRPHQLTIEAIGPFAHQVAVDFDDVASDGLFLIHGPTGAGKTSVLDALCFALYGEVPGQRGDRGLLSDHAARGAVPRVTLEFSSQGGRYRIERRPYYESPKLRGTGTTPRNPTATLERLDAPAPALTKVAEVKAEVRRLVGLTARQFQQVILLPQGQFEQVLQGKPEAREDLLKTLFHTVEFEELAGWLAEEARTRRSAVTEARRRLAVVAEDAAHHGALVLDRADGLDLTPEGEGEARLFDPELGLGGLPDQATLDRLATRAEAACRAADAELGAADAALTLHRAELEAATARARLWDRRDRARVEVGHLARLRPGIDRTRLVVQRADQAEQLRAGLDLAARAEQVCRQVAGAGTRAVEQVATARPAVARPLDAVATLDLSLGATPTATAVATARRAVASEQAALTALADTARQAATARAAAAERRAEAERLRVAAAGSATAAQRARDAAASIGSEEAAAVEAAARVDGLAEAATVARRRAEAAERLVAVRRRLVRATTTANQAAATANEAWSASLDLRARYLDGIAAVLAAQLQDAGPCPVCGSPDHPVPAEPAADAVAVAVVDAAEARAETANVAATAARDAQAELERQEAGLRAEAGAVAADAAAAQAAAALAADAHRDAERRAGAAPTLASQRREHETRAATLATQAAEAATAAGSAEEAAGVQDGLAAAATARLQAVLGPAVDLATAVAALGRLDAALEHLAEHAERAERAAHARVGAVERVAVEVGASPFADAEEATAALVDAAGRRTRAQEVADHDQRAALVAERLADPELADLPDARPDDGAVRVAAAAADRAKEAAVAGHTAVHAAAARLAERTEQHRGLLAELAPLEADAHLHEAVANRCAGRAVPKVSLQRWVLATYLEGICEHANRRLNAMTGGRYQLRVARETLHAAAKAGLDLRVLDAHTGHERPVSTLSGGETFQASLALALGVADSVEARTGGVRLDALFVDEGFGTLDTDSLELALDELDGLRAGGRMVGVISHVPGLRERIRLGIEVTPSRAGSTLRTGEVAAG